MWALKPHTSSSSPFLPCTCGPAPLPPAYRTICKPHAKTPLPPRLPFPTNATATATGTAATTASPPRPRRQNLGPRLRSQLFAADPAPRPYIAGFVASAEDRRFEEAPPPPLRRPPSPRRDVRDMLPGPVLPPPPLPSVFTGSPSPPASDPHSSSIVASVAIIFIVVIATITLTTCVALLRRGCLRRQGRLFRSSLSCCSSESEMQSAASAVPSELPVKGSELVASMSVSAEMPKGGMDTLVPSAPYLPEVERLILELLSLPAVPMKPGSGCAMCKEFLPTDVLLILPVCSHIFHQACIISWLRHTTPSCCPSCHASITILGSNKTLVTPTFCSVEYDIESQMLMPTSPGEAVAKAVGGSHGWLRSSLDRLSGSWRGCSSNHATAAVVPVSSWRTTGSWSQGSSGRLDNDSDCAKVQKPLPVPDGKEVPEAVRSSIGWLRSLATLSGSWSGCSSSCSSEMGLPVTSRHVTETLASSGHSETDTWSSWWDLEAATPTPGRPSLYGYARWCFRSSG